MPLDDRANLGLAFVAQSRSPNLRHVAHLEQTVDAAQAPSIRLDAKWRSGRTRLARRPADGCTSKPSCPPPFNFKIKSFISRVPMGSKPLVGSSSKIKSGSLISAWASPRRRRHALGILPHLPPAGPAQTHHFDQRRGRVLSAPWRACRTGGHKNRASPRHSETDTDTFLPAGSRCRSFFFTSVASLPSTIARPVVGNNRPNSSLMVVDLPEPLGPNSPKISPLYIVRSRAFRAPNLLPTPKIAVGFR